MSRRYRQRAHDARSLLLILALLSLLLPSATPPPVRAATYDIADGDVASLLAAIQDVHEDVTVNLAPGGTYLFDQQVGGATLSTIVSANLTINGNGATIARS